MPRGIELDKEGIYHVRGQVVGEEGYYPLQEEENAQKLISIIKHYSDLYFCEPAGLELMGDHYHETIRFEAYRQLSEQELLELAKKFYPGKHRPYRHWNKEDWERFNRRVFNVSEYMRNVQQTFACWFNKRHKRKGPFWAGRFRSTESDNQVETLFYVELNAVRARLVKRPEDWRYSSVWMRANRQDSWLMPLEKLLGIPNAAEAEKLYWVLLYWRGTKPSKEDDGVIPFELAEQMEREKFERGCYLQKIASFSNGGAIGTWDKIAKMLENPREKAGYRRERRPVPVGVGDLYALRRNRRK